MLGAGSVCVGYRWAGGRWAARAAGRPKLLLVAPAGWRRCPASNAASASARLALRAAALPCCRAPPGRAARCPHPARPAAARCPLRLPTRQVIDLISLKPFDMETISKSIRKTRKVGRRCGCCAVGAARRAAPPLLLSAPACARAVGNINGGRAARQCPTSPCCLTRPPLHAPPHHPAQAIIVEECMKTGGIGASLSAVIHESLFNELDHEVGAWGSAGWVGRWAGGGAGWRSRLQRGAPTRRHSAHVQPELGMPAAAVAGARLLTCASPRRPRPRLCALAGAAPVLPGRAHLLCVRAGGRHHCAARAGGGRGAEGVRRARGGVSPSPHSRRTLVARALLPGRGCGRGGACAAAPRPVLYSRPSFTPSPSGRTGV